MESTKCHLGAIIVRDLSISISNYRSKMSLEEYCRQENVLGIANIDTRALTKELRETGCLVGIVTTDTTKSDAELVAQAKSWTIVGKDLLSVVSCTEPYEWRQSTLDEWEFAAKAKTSTGAPLHVSVYEWQWAHVCGCGVRWGVCLFVCCSADGHGTWGRKGAWHLCMCTTTSLVCRRCVIRMPQCGLGGNTCPNDR